jgi:hypothetical protein
MPPTFLQRLFLAILPQSWAESMVADSMAWHAHCPCGHARSIWDLGGIRWKATGNPRKLIRCPECGQSTWHTVQKFQPAEEVHPAS